MINFLNLQFEELYLSQIQKIKFIRKFLWKFFHN